MSAPDELLSAMWQAIGRYSAEICRPDAELAPPPYLLEAVDALAKRAPTAPQGAEIAREPTAAMIVEGTKELAHVIANDVTGKARHIWYAMYDAALTPTDAETKG